MTLKCRYLILMTGTMFAAASSSANASNALIGRWHLSSWIPNTNPNWLAPVCGITYMVFTPTTAVQYDPAAEPSVAVTYNIQPRKIVVSSANDVIYYIVDATHIRRDDSGKYTYRRVS